MQVLLVDDHVMFRHGLMALLESLESDLDFAEADNCEQAVDRLANGDAGLVLLDMNLPGKRGLEALDAVMQAAPDTKVVVLSGADNPDLIRKAIQRGASGFVPKTASSEILVAALKLILAGGIYLPKVVLPPEDQPPDSPGNTPGRSLPELLSKRQTAVLLHAIQGRPNKVIAQELGIAEGTVKTHLSAAYRLLGVNNRTEAVFAAARLGLRTSPGGTD